MSPEPWRDEVAGRIAQIERGEVEPVEWRVVEAKIRASLARSASKLRPDRGQAQR